jgi:hypothetical protein
MPIPLIAAALGGSLLSKVAGGLVAGNSYAPSKVEQAGKRFKTPKAYKDMVNTFSGQKNMGSPEARLVSEDAQQQFSDALEYVKSNASTYTDVLGAIGKAGQARTKGMREAAAMEERARIEATAREAGAKQNLAEAELRTEQMNEQRRQAEIARQEQNAASIQNTFDSIGNDIMSIGMMGSELGLPSSIGENWGKKKAAAAPSSGTGRALGSGTLKAPRG